MDVKGTIRRDPTGQDTTNHYLVLKNLVLWAKPVPHCGSQRYLALPWSFVSKITISKHPAKKTAGRQITNKSQFPIFNTRRKRLRYA
jgi:hypothetical protein